MIAMDTVIGKEMPVVPKDGSCTPIVSTAPKLPVLMSSHNPVSSSEQLHSESSDVTLREREEQRSSIKTKYKEVFEVNANCERFAADIDNYSDEINVKGRLHMPSSIEFYKEIGASSFVLNMLKEGHHPRLREPVPNYELKNNASYFSNQIFAEEEIMRLLSKNRIEIVKEKPKCVNPLTVVVQRTKSRLILDCSFLNKYIDIPHIKYEGHETAMNYFKKGGFMFSFDLRDGYHHLLIAPEFRTYLGFKIMIKGVPTYFQYIVGCFGLADLPWAFTKLYRPLVRHWRSIGIPAIMFLDDGGFFEADKQTAQKHSDHVRKDLIRSGSVYSIKKSNFIPSQKMTWLGFDWDTNKGCFSAASHRVEKIKNTCDSLLSVEICLVKKLASFVGQIVSLLPVAGNCVRIMTKGSSIFVAS